MASDKAKSWQRWFNPKPMSREWWIQWFVGLVFFGSLMSGVVLYFYFTESAGSVPNGNAPDEKAPEPNAADREAVP
jgi:hypothetical protein